MEVIDINSSLKRSELSRLFGRRGHESFSCSLRAKLENCKRTLTKFLEPQLHHRMQGIDRIEIESVGLQGGTTFRSHKLAKALKDSEQVICFVATLGGGLDREIGRLMAEKRLSEAYVLDAMGSVAVEDMVEQFYQRKQIEFAVEHKSVTLRFSPGYCDWPVTEQKQLFSLFGSEHTGVELLDSCLMTPRKSISGIFGLFYSTNTRLDSPYNPCRDCKKTDCVARRS
jgi:hypothetical protein